MKKLELTLLAFFLLFTFSCSELTTETILPELFNKLWVLESFEVNGRIDVPPSNQVYNIQFTEDKKFTGTNDCNSILGDFSIELKSISINNIISTEVYCGKESLDYRYLQALERAESYEIELSEFIINYGINSKLNFVAR